MDVSTDSGDKKRVIWLPQKWRKLMTTTNNIIRIITCKKKYYDLLKIYFFLFNQVDTAQ